MIGADIAQWGVALELHGEDTISQGFDRVAARGEKAAKRVEEAFSRTEQEIIGQAVTTARQFGTELERQFAQDSARIKEGLARGFLTPQDAKRAGQDAAREYNAGVLSQLDALGAAGRNASNSKVYVELAGSLKTVETVAARTGPSLSSVRSAVQSLAASAVSAVPGVAQLTGVVGQMALGATTTIGILAGVAAIAYAYDKLTESARKAREEQERIAKVGQDYLDNLKRPAGDLGTAATAKSEEAARLKAQIDALTAARDSLSKEAGGFEKANALNNQITALTPQFMKASAEAKVLTDRVKELTDAAHEQDNSKIWQAIAFDLGQLEDQLASLEIQSDKITAKLATTTTQWAQASAAYRAAADAAAYLAKSTATLQDQVSRIGARNKGIAVAGLDASAETAQRAILRDAENTARAIQDSVKAATDLADAFGLIDQTTKQIIVSLTQIGSSIQPLIEQIKALNSGSPAGSVLGVVGAIAPIVGGIGALFDALESGTEAARRRRQAEESLTQSLEQSTNNIRVQIGLMSDLDAQIAQQRVQQRIDDQQAAALVTNQFLDKYGTHIGQHLAELNAAIAQAVAANDALYQQLEETTRKNAAAASAAYAEDLRVRLLRAQGNDAAADALELQLKQERERAALIKSFGDVIDPTEAATLALLDQVQAQEKLAATAQKVASGFLNIDDGLKVLSARFNAITPSPSLGTVIPLPVPQTYRPAPSGPIRTTEASEAPATIVLNMDGREVARGVVKNLQRSSSATFGTTVNWSKVSSS